MPTSTTLFASSPPSSSTSRIVSGAGGCTIDYDYNWRDDPEVDRNEIRKILIRNLPPLPKQPYSGRRRLLDRRIEEIIGKSVPVRSSFDGSSTIKQYYDFNLIIPPSLLELVQGFEWNGKFLNPKINLISGCIRFSKLDSFDMICNYPALQQVSDINSIIFIAVGKDILGVRVSDVEQQPSNFNIHIFRENATNFELKSLLEIVQGFSCWNISTTK